MPFVLRLIAALALGLAAAGSALAQEALTSLVAGTPADRAACAAANGAWVAAEGRPECIRYAVSGAGGRRTDAVVEIPGDFLALGRDMRAVLKVPEPFPTAQDLQRRADLLAQRAGTAAVVLARPGTQGSSGNQLADSGSKRELALLSATLDQIRRDQGFERLHVAGQGVGGNIVAGFLESRDDMACAVAAGASLAEKNRLAVEAVAFPPALLRRLHDPIDRIDAIKARDGQRFFVLIDRAAASPPPEVPRGFAETVRGNGVPVGVVEVTPVDGEPGLKEAAARALVACAKGEDDRTVEAAARAGGTAAPPRPAVTADRRPAPGPAVAPDARPASPPPPAAPADRRPEEKPAAPPPPAPAAEAAWRKIPFSTDELRNGKKPDEAACRADEAAVWVVVDGLPSCIRYYLADQSNGQSKDAVFFLAHTNGRTETDGSYRPRPGYGSETPDDIYGIAKSWSTLHRGPFAVIARPGSYGSSGKEQSDAGEVREVRIIDAAIDAIKARHGLDHVALSGYHSGGQLVATLALQRKDIQCAAAISSIMALKEQVIGRGRNVDPLDASRFNDPIDALARPGLNRDVRLFYVADRRAAWLDPKPLDAFFKAAKDAGAQVFPIDVQASDAEFSRTVANGNRAAVFCASGQPTDRILRDVAAFRAPAPAAPAAPVADAKPKDPSGAPMPMTAEVMAPKETAPMSMEFFTIKDVVDGIRADRAVCQSYAYAVWVTVQGQSECVRYFYSNAGGAKEDMIIAFQGDYTSRGADGKLSVPDFYEKLSAETLTLRAEQYSRVFGGPFAQVARPGVNGSSGLELQIRHSKREVAIIDAALTAIKERHGVKRFHLIGQSGGGGLAYNLPARRQDLGCVVSASGDLALRILFEEFEAKQAASAAWIIKNADPYDVVDKIQKRPDLRLFILVDPNDKVVIPASTARYVARLKERGLPHQYIETMATDDKNHGLYLHGIRAAIACALGQTDTQVADIVQRTVQFDKKIPEMSGPMADIKDKPVVAAKPAAKRPQGPTAQPEATGQ